MMLAMLKNKPVMETKMAKKQPYERDQEIVRFWIKKIYEDIPHTFLTIDYSKASPPAGTASLYTGGPSPFNVIFECKQSINMEENPFTYIRDPRD